MIETGTQPKQAQSFNTPISNISTCEAARASNPVHILAKVSEQNFTLATSSILNYDYLPPFFSEFKTHNQSETLYYPGTPLLRAGECRSRGIETTIPSTLFLFSRLKPFLRHGAKLHQPHFYSSLLRTRPPCCASQPIVHGQNEKGRGRISSRPGAAELIDLSRNHTFLSKAAPPYFYQINQELN